MSFIHEIPSYTYTVERRHPLTDLGDGLFDGQHYSTSGAQLKTKIYPVPLSICLLPVVKFSKSPRDDMKVVIGLPYKYEATGVLKGYDLQGECCL